MISSGTVLADRYRVVRHLGTGGMASVYLAVDETLGREVAVKRIHADPASELGRRIQREARLGAGARDPGIVTVFDVVADGEALLLVMEFVDGETLADTLSRGALDPERAVKVLERLAQALDHLHERGVVHRDVKPANVLLSTRGTVKLSDLGVATSSEATQITRTGGLIGTAAYMAPEQFESGPATPAVDVYALAAMAFESLGGRRPYTGSTPFDVLGRVRDKVPPPDVRELKPDLPPAVTEALRRGMATDPHERPHSAGAFVAELAAALHPVRATQPITAPQPVTEPAPAPARAATHAPRRTRDRRALPAVVALLGAVALVAVLLAAGLGGGDGDGDRAATTAPERDEVDRLGTATPETAPAEPDALPAADPATAAGAVRAFYERAAAQRTDQAWALAAPDLRAQFGSLGRFRGTFATLRSIRFGALRTTGREGRAATVAFRTTARHTNRTDRCTGTARATRAGDGWRVGRIDVDCS